MEEKKKILEIKNLSVSFDTYAGEVQAVRDASWDVMEGETVAIVGESGCGKTVTIQTVMGINRTDNCRIKSGEILFKGDDLVKKTRKEMHKYQGKDMSIIFQDPFTYLNPTSKVRNQIREGYLKHYKVSKKEANEKVIELLKIVNIPNPERVAKQYPHELSGGMRQRVMIAMALICNPKILFADEPTTALDVTVQAQIIDLMNQLKDDFQASIVLITHDMGVVANMADRIYVMYAGKIVEHGLSEDIFYHPKHPYTIGLLQAAPRLDQKKQDLQYSIPGTPPDLINPPKGCPFAARCPHTMNICVEEFPENVYFGDNNHFAACWLNHPACLKEKQIGGEKV
ncbi:MAG: ABC transporter ATP-binding protein [Eubacteriales bacterium]|nr:ABC transporter ATP-binding protein [Eubacteriales bacterium]